MTSPGEEERRGGALHELDVIDPWRYGERTWTPRSVPIDIPPSKTPSSNELDRRRRRFHEAARQSMDEMDMRMSSFARSHSNQSAFSVASSNDGSQAADRGSRFVPLATPDNPWHQGQGGRGFQEQEQQQQQQQQMMTTPSAESAYGVGSPPREFSRLQQRGSFTTHPGVVDPSPSGGGGGGGGFGFGGRVGARRRHSYTYAVGSHDYTFDCTEPPQVDDDDDDDAVSGRYSTPRQRQLRDEEEDGRFGHYADGGYAGGYGGAGARSGAGEGEMSTSSFSGAHRVGGFSRPWCRSAAEADGASSAAAGAAATANPAGVAAGRGGDFAHGGGVEVVGHARGLVYAEYVEGDGRRGAGRGGGGRGGVRGDDSGEEGMRAREETDEEDDDDLADGVFNMELL